MNKGWWHMYYEDLYPTGIKNCDYDTIRIYAKNIFIEDAELGFEFDLSEKIKQFNKIIINGITFVREKKDE